MKRRTAGFLATLMLTGLLTAGCAKDKKVCEEKIYSYYYPEIGSVEIYKRIPKSYVLNGDTYKLLFKAPDNKLILEIVIPKNSNSSFSMTDQHGDVYVLDQKYDYGLKLKFRAERDQ